jgi:hypothetical protein
MRIRLFGGAPVASPSSSKPTVALIAQDRLAGIDIAAQHRINAFARLRSASPALAPLVVLPVSTRRIDIALLPGVGANRNEPLGLSHRRDDSLPALTHKL